MKKITIPLSGITRNTDDAISQDGECLELINARVKNGSISPIGRPILEITFPEGRKPIFIHKNSGYTHYLSYSSAGILYFEYRKDTTGYHSIGEMVCELPSLIKIESIGNTLICISEIGIKYIVFNNSEYNVLGEKPDYLMQFVACEEKEVSTGEFYCYFDYTKQADFIGTDNMKIDPRDIKKLHDTIESYRNKALAPLSNENRFVNPVLIRYALKTYSGDYFMHSPVAFVCPGYSVYKSGKYFSGLAKAVRTAGDEGLGFKIEQKVKTYKIKHSYFPELDLWKDVISSVDIFISTELDLVKKDTIAFYDGGAGGGWGFLDSKVLSKEKIIDKIANESLFYRTLSMPIEGVSDKFLSPTNVFNDTLPDDSFSRNLLAAKSSFVYNGRIHLGNIKSRLFGGFIRELSFDLETESINGLPISLGISLAKSYTYIRTDGGEKIVYAEHSFLRGALNPYLFYPDSRAFKVVLFTGLYQNGNNTYRSRRFDLKSSNTLNSSFYIEYGDDFSNPNGFSPIDLTKGSVITEEEFTNPGIAVNEWDTSPNKLKVSALNNPFVFPVEQTYTVSNGEIVGMASATSALSQGQFGRFPLYIFSTDGVFAMSVGSGKISYATSAPVSRDSCNNPKSITSIDNAVIFSTDAGLMLLSGSTVQKISDKIEGYLPSSFLSSPVLNKIISIPKLEASCVEFRDYINGAILGYVYEEKEIIVSNNLYPYSYLYNIQSGEWSKLSVSPVSFLNSYPELLAVVVHGQAYHIYNMHNPHRTINDIAIITRPVKMGSLTHKRILQSALRGIIKPSLSDLYFRGEPVQFRDRGVTAFSAAGFYILGSNDAEHFSLLVGTEKIEDIRDLITKMNKTKALKFFMFCLVGGVRTDVAINYIEVMADEMYDNRLR